MPPDSLRSEAVVGARPIAASARTLPRRSIATEGLVLSRRSLAEGGFESTRPDQFWPGSRAFLLSAHFSSAPRRLRKFTNCKARVRA
jgi:hypothetical protein